MKTSADRYTYRITWSEEDQEYIGLCAEFPSLSWLAATQEKALRGIGELVAKVITDMRRKSEVPPSPLSGRRFSGRFIVRVPPDVHRDLAVEAAEAGVSLNRLVSAKLSHRYTQEEWVKIERMVAERGRQYKTARAAKKHLKAL